MKSWRFPILDSGDQSVLLCFPTKKPIRRCVERRDERKQEQEQEQEQEQGYEQSKSKRRTLKYHPGASRVESGNDESMPKDTCWRVEVFVP